MKTLKNNKKRLSAAEKQKRYREKRRQDAEREALYKAKHKLRNSKRKKASEMTSREHRLIKRKWRIASAMFRERRKALEASLESPSQSEAVLCASKIKKQTKHISQSESIPKSTQMRQDRKCVMRNREIKEIEEKIEELQRLIDEKTKEIDKCRKRYERELVRKRSINQTPKSKKKIMMENLGIRKDSIKHEVSKKLAFRDVIMSDLKTTYSSLYNACDKRMIGKVVYSKLLQKYKMQRKAAHASRLTYKKHIAAIEIKKIEEKYEKIKQFFLRDDVSHVTAGKKETLTKNKLKMQKRFLLDSMKALYKKFCDEKITALPVSFSLFTKCRPYFVLKPTDDDRDTCRCVQHANLEFMACKLHHLKVLPTANLHSLLSFLACDKNNFKCMFNICKSCIHKTIPVSAVDLNNTTTWRKWSKMKKKRHKTIDGKMISFFVNVQQVVTLHGTVNELINSFQSQMRIFKSHYYKIRHQNKSFIECKEQLSSTEAAIVIDFSENYNCKLHEKIQSNHFGASWHEVILHTGVLYMKDKSPISFASISPSKIHGPSAIWAHLEPIMDLLRKDYPNIQVLHFFSDGPHTQYRQKKNFVLFAVKISDFKFKAATWSFFESSHRKGAANGVWATLKRTADKIVARGADIPDAETLYQMLQIQGLKVKIFYIPQEKVDSYFQLIPSNLTAVKDTHSIHQMLITNPQNICYRYVSCFCLQNKWTSGKFCNCFQSFKFALNVSIKDKRPQIYSVDEDTLINYNFPGVSGYESNIQPSVYVLFKVFGDNSNNKVEYRYAGVCQEYDTVHGEVKVAFLRVNGENGQLFQLNKEVSYIEFDQIISILPEPKFVIEGNRFSYRFPFPIDVFERA